MPKLFIVNATQQIHQFTFWLPGAGRSTIQEIPIGGQIQVGNRDLTAEAITDILEKKAVYGLVSVADALRTGRAAFHGHAYQVDKQVPFGKILELIEKYNSILNQRGRQIRQEAAVATNQFLEDKLFETAALLNRAPPRVDALEMHVEEVGRDPGDTSDEVNEKVRVERGATEARPPVRRRRSRSE